MMMTPRERRSMKIAQICDRHGVTLDEMMGRSRLPHVCSARNEAYVMLREEKLSYPKIGKIFGRDHTTVINGVKRYIGGEHGKREEA